MSRRTKTARTLGEHGIFGDEEAAQLRAELDDVRAAIADLNGRVHAQFTTISAHAEIAREQADLARNEARSDLERSREALIGLIEQVRDEVGAGSAHHVAGSMPGPSTEVYGERVATVEERLDQIGETVERCFARQQELADTMAAFLDTMLAEQRSEPVAGLSLA